MATPRKGAPADDPDAFQRGQGVALDAGTDCAACHAPLPEGNRYVCAACAEDSGHRAATILSGLRGPSADTLAAGPAADLADSGEADEIMDCPTCGMTLDASGRCAGCVTTVRR